MPSVVDTSVKHFHSGMGGAPILNGVAGSMISLLNACLKDGFDTKSVTSLVVASGVATLSFSGSHSATVDTVILVAGSSIADLNGEQKITAIGAGFVRFATAAANGTATGTITFKMASASWTQPFTGTNLATYKSGDPASTGMILRVDDTGSTSSRFVGYEKMTDVNTGAGSFPTEVQIAGGGYWSKSSTANALASSWFLFVDSRKFILHIAPHAQGSNVNYGGYTRGFGDDISTRPGGDPYAASLCYSKGTSFSVQNEACLDGNGITQHAMPRSYTGLGTCILNTVAPYTGAPATSGRDLYFGTFPSEVDGGLILSRKYFSTATERPVRSDLPGLLHAAQGNLVDFFKSGDIISGTGLLAGRKLMALTGTTSPVSAPLTSNAGISFVDVTGPWR